MKNVDCQSHMETYSGAQYIYIMCNPYLKREHETKLPTCSYCIHDVIDELTTQKKENELAERPKEMR